MNKKRIANRKKALGAGWLFLLELKQLLREHIPYVERQDVIRIIRKEFSAELEHQVLKALGEYGTLDYHVGKQRVYMAILKLSEGDLDKLNDYVRMACEDYRDVIGCAESPGFMEVGFVGVDKMSKKEVKKLKKDDWQQYKSWSNVESIKDKISNAITTGLVLDSFLLLIASTIMDGGMILAICLSFAGAHIAGSILLLTRHHRNLSRFDFGFIKYGMLGICVVSMLLCLMISLIKG